MNTRITSVNFKSIVLGDSTVKELYPHHQRPPEIKVEFEENRTIIKGNFELSEDIIFSANEIYERELFFDGGNYKNIVFRGGKFTKVLFRRGTYKGYVSIRGGEIGSIILLGGNFLHWLGTLDGTMNKDNEGKLLAEDPLIINRFEIEGGSYLNNIWLSGGDIKSLEIKCVTPIVMHCMPNDDKLFDDSKNKYETKFKSKPRIDNLLISRYSNKNTFYHFSELELTNLRFENFTNLGNITLSQISLSDNLSISNSDLGKTTFIDCDFSNRDMTFNSSKINEIALAGVKLPRPENINISDSGNKNQKKLALSQIKKVFQNMGDNLMASEYQTEELNTYESMLSLTWEKVNLWLNKVTNNHGQSWIRPLFLLLISSGIFFTIYCLTLGYKIEIDSYDNFKLFLNNLSYFFEFLNPIRKSDFLPQVLLGSENISQISNLTFLTDSIAKIINAYLLYQFIAAFRKFGRTNK